MKNVNHHQVAEIQLVYSSKIKASQRQTLSDPRNAEAILRQSWNPQTIELFEQFKVLLLNQANQVLGIYCASCGGVSQTVVDVKLLFCAALKANASAIIIAHNHPSGNLKASDADIQITRKLSEAASLLDIRLLDHIILTQESYFSFSDKGLL